MFQQQDIFLLSNFSSVKKQQVLPAIESFKDIINLYNCFLKNDNYSIKTTNYWITSNIIN